MTRDLGGGVIRRSGPHRAVSVGVATAVLLLITGASPARAAALAASGWWSQLSPLTPGGAPSDVPPGGLLVQGDRTQPLALTGIQLPDDIASEPTTLTLVATGTSVMTMPPVACPSVSAIKAVRNGSWADRPHYDCSTSVSASTEAPSGQLRFALPGAVSRNWVILGGGPQDRIVIAPPTSDAATAAGQQGPQPASPRPDPPVTSGTATTTSVSTAKSALPQQTAPLSLLPAQTPMTQTSPGTGQQPAPMLAAAATNAPTSPIGAPGASRTSPNRHPWAAGLGLALLVLLLTYWADGFGAVPIRAWLAHQNVRQIEPRTLAPDS